MQGRDEYIYLFACLGSGSQSGQSRGQREGRETESRVMDPDGRMEAVMRCGC